MKVAFVISVDFPQDLAEGLIAGEPNAMREAQESISCDYGYEVEVGVIPVGLTFRSRLPGSLGREHRSSY